MNQAETLITAIGISVLLSSATVFALHGPMRRLLDAVCPLQTTASFWTRAAVTVLYLLPLCVVLAFGIPELSRLGHAPPMEVARRSLAASSFALVGIVVAIGLRLSSVRPPSRFDYPPPAR
jgi:hypothetical protein